MAEMTKKFKLKIFFNNFFSDFDKLGVVRTALFQGFQNGIIYPYCVHLQSAIEIQTLGQTR